MAQTYGIIGIDLAKPFDGIEDTIGIVPLSMPNIDALDPSDTLYPSTTLYPRED